VVGGSVYSNLTGDLKDWRYGKGLQAEIARALAVDSRDPRVAFAGVMLLVSCRINFATNELPSLVN